MQALEALYLSEVKKSDFKERKQRLTQGKHLMISTPSSGITSLIYDFLRSLENPSYLYINLKDPRLEHIESSTINVFLQNHPLIDTLIIEGYEEGLELIDIPTTILVSDTNIHVEGFNTQYLYPLDFEEFVGFDTSTSSIEHIFSSFLQIGTFPAVLKHDKNMQTEYYQQLIKKSFPENNTYTLYIHLAKYMGAKVSVFQLFGYYKVLHKTSKDSFYATIKTLQDKQMLFLIGKYGATKGTKKLYFLDHALMGHYRFEKALPRVFENMVFLELYKHNIEVYYDTYYTFIAPLSDTAYICAPFVQTQYALKKIEQSYKHKEFTPKKVVYITTSLEGNYEKRGINIEIIPFYMWALSL